jgi:ABC-type antimicrobial peptide transport system permease subunit
VSPFPSVDGQDALVSMTTFLRMTGGLYTSVDELPMQRMLLQLTDDASDNDVEGLVSSLEAITRDSKVDVWSFSSAVEPINKANRIMEYFFNGTTIVAMLISFFSLMASMYSNIYEQTKEIAVIRAVGVKRNWIFRMYLYEAFVVVFGASLLGTLIGTLIGWTMTLQRVLFTQLPITLTFPWALLGVILCVSVLVSMLASFAPVYRVVRQRIVQIMRFVA